MRPVETHNPDTCACDFHVWKRRQDTPAVPAPAPADDQVTLTPWPVDQTVGTARLLDPAHQQLHRRDTQDRTVCGRRWTFRFTTTGVRGARADGYRPCPTCAQPQPTTLTLTPQQVDSLRFVLGVVVDDLSNMESEEDRDALYAVAAMLGMDL